MMIPPISLGLIWTCAEVVVVSGWPVRYREVLGSSLVESTGCGERGTSLHSIFSLCHEPRSVPKLASTFEIAHEYPKNSHKPTTRFPTPLASSLNLSQISAVTSRSQTAR